MKNLFITLILGAIVLYGFSYLTSTNYFELPGLSDPEEEFLEWKSVTVMIFYPNDSTGTKTFRIPSFSELHAPDSDGDGIKELMVKCPEDPIIQTLIGCNLTLERNIKDYVVIDL